MKKILIIDDSKTQLAIMASVLRGGGFDVVISENGGDGYAQAQKWKPDLIFLDIVLSSTMSGFDVLDELKKDPSVVKDVPVVMLTGRSSGEDVAKGFQKGAKDYLLKYNTMPKVLLEKVKQYLG
jgi:twitching motility two-component system response regulator PilH